MTATLPRLLVLTDRRQADRPLVQVVRAAIDGGARAFVLREKELPRNERERLAEELRTLLRPVNGVLLTASDATLPGDGVHLASRDPFPTSLPRPELVGRSCHDAQELAGAVAEGCAYATLSPIFATDSKPGYGPALGTDALAALVTKVAVPTYALGGISADNAPACLAAGAFGIAVMGAVMRAAHPDRAVAALLAALGHVRSAGIGAT